MNIEPSYNLLTILGPTASGKTRLAVALAKAMGGEIISADSRQVFRGMDIGSGKDLSEYGDTPYHLINILDAGEEFNVFRFQQLFLHAFEDISQRGHLPLLCGGTGMYLDAALRGYHMVEVPKNPQLRSRLETMEDAQLEKLLTELRPQQHNRTDLADRNRTIRAIEISMHERASGITEKEYPEIMPLIIGIRWERSRLRERITARLRQRLENGMIEEVQRLHDAGIPWERLEYYGLEYRHISRFLQGAVRYNDMFQQLNSAIHDFAKRQETWFRRMEKHGVIIHWVDGSGDPLGETIKILADAK